MNDFAYEVRVCDSSGNGALVATTRGKKSTSVNVDNVVTADGSGPTGGSITIEDMDLSETNENGCIDVRFGWNLSNLTLSRSGFCFNTPDDCPQSATASASGSSSSGGSSSGGAIALVAIAAGGYYWWKKRQIANGNAAAMALLPDVSFDLDRSNRRAFYTKMNWANSSSSNWQIRSAFNLHTKYSGQLLDWNADSHIGYKLRGKFGEFNPYLRGKFVQNAPENAEMQTRYSFGLNYQMPNRFAIQIVQPDRELENYALGIQWRGKSKIRYSLQNETSRNSYRFTGEFSFK